MDSQVKKGLLDYCVLATLQKEDSYGYQLIREISAYVEISESTLYPILRRLEQNAYVTVYSVEHNNRLRKYYHLTEHGIQHLAEFNQEQDKLLQILSFIANARGKRHE